MSEASLVKALKADLLQAEDYASGTSYASAVKHAGNLILEHNDHSYSQAFHAAQGIIEDCTKLEVQGHGIPPSEIGFIVGIVRTLDTNYHYWPNSTPLQAQGSVSLNLPSTTDILPGGLHI
jgi:hypothetical protein